MNFRTYALCPIQPIDVLSPFITLYPVSLLRSMWDLQNMGRVGSEQIKRRPRLEQSHPGNYTIIPTFLPERMLIIHGENSLKLPREVLKVELGASSNTSWFLWWKNCVLVKLPSKKVNVDLRTKTMLYFSFNRKIQGKILSIIPFVSFCKSNGTCPKTIRGAIPSISMLYNKYRLWILRSLFRGLRSYTAAIPMQHSSSQNQEITNSFFQICS